MHLLKRTGQIHVRKIKNKAQNIMKSKEQTKEHYVDNPSYRRKEKQNPRMDKQKRAESELLTVVTSELWLRLE